MITSLESPTSSFLYPPSTSALAPIKLPSSMLCLTVDPSASTESRTIEWSITAGAFASFMLILAIFSKILPLISIWEVAEEAEAEPASGDGEVS